MYPIKQSTEGGSLAAPILAEQRRIEALDQTELAKLRLRLFDQSQQSRSRTDLRAESILAGGDGTEEIGVDREALSRARGS